MSVNRTVAPEIVNPEHINIIKGDKLTTKGGVDIYNLAFSEYDVVRVSLVFKAGTKYQQKPFSASSTLSMLSEGCQKYTAQEISDMLDFYGIYYDVSIDRDYSIITICSLSKFFDKAIEILRSVIIEPLFPENEFDIFKSKRKQSIVVHRSKIDYVAREVFAEAIFGANHPYGVSSCHTKFDDLSTQDLKDYYNEFYCRDNVFVVVSGNVSQDAMSELSEMVDSLQEGSKKEDVNMAFESQKLVLKEWKDSLQAAIRVGRRLFSRTHEDFVGMQVVSTILGGYFGARLISNLREDKGYTYGIFAGMLNLQETGYMAISTEVEVSVCQDAVDQIFYEMERLQTERVGEHELQMVKNVMIGEIMRILDGPFGIADITIENIQNDYDNRKLEDMLEEIKSITPERIVDLARRYLNREDFTVVVVGGSYESEG